jgi:DNA-binding MarR family transcriptional regulator
MRPSGDTNERAGARHSRRRFVVVSRTFEVSRDHALTVNSVYNLLPSRMVSDMPPSDADARADDSTRPSSHGLGPALRRAWVGYQLRLDAAMADAGFGERRLPDGRALRLCSGQAGSTISAIGRELGITRQGAGKVVAHLRDRGYVSIADSPTSKREKSVMLTSRGVDYLQTQRAAARAIEDDLRDALGETGFSSLHALLNALDDGEMTRMSTYLRRAAGS